MFTPLVRLSMVRERNVRYDARVTSAEQAASIVREIVGNDADESFFVLALDVKNRVSNVYRVAKGGSESVALIPRDVFRTAVMCNASGVIVAHNHPSGDTEPSDQDRHITRALKDAAALLGIRFLDSLVVTQTSFKSIL